MAFTLEPSFIAAVLGPLWIRGHDERLLHIEVAVDAPEGFRAEYTISKRFAVDCFGASPTLPAGFRAPKESTRFALR